MTVLLGLGMLLLGVMALLLAGFALTKLLIWMGWL